jgi:predicted PurR-regulated permease PerM
LGAQGDEVFQSIIQIVLGNFVDPKLQGRALKLSAVVVLLAVVFWGWIWGLGGAIIGVPLTVFIFLRRS